jgi:biopolymer transport protein ExbD
VRSFPRSLVAAPQQDPGLVALEDTLRGLAASHAGHREVRIVAETHTRYDEIIEVMDAARAAGLPEAALSDDGGENS